MTKYIEIIYVHNFVFYPTAYEQHHLWLGSLNNMVTKKGKKV